MLTKKLAPNEVVLKLLTDCNFDLDRDTFKTFEIFVVTPLHPKSIYSEPTILGFLDLCYYALLGRSLTAFTEAPYYNTIFDEDNYQQGKELYEKIMDETNDIKFPQPRKTRREPWDSGPEEKC